MSEFRPDYHPTDKQRLYHRSNADELLYGGAAAGGKTTATVMEAFKQCITHPGISAYIFRRTFPELEKSILAESFKWLTGIGKYSSVKHEWTFPNGSKMVFCHCQYPKDRYIYQGAEINALYIDELTHFTKEIYDYLKTRVRAAKSLNFRPRTNCTSNPGGIGHAWVKQAFADLEPFEMYEYTIKLRSTGKELTRTRQYIPARVTDNPHVDDGYIFELEQKPENLRKALLDGSWDVFEGQVFYEFTDDVDGYFTRHRTHVIEPFEIPQFWGRYRSFDFGYAKPFSVLWWAVDHDGRAYLYREWYGASAANVGIKLTPEQIAEGILEREKYDGEVIGYADPAIWDHASGDSVADQMRRSGVSFNQGDNARLSGKMQMHNRLQFDENGIPMLYVFRNCPHFIRTIPTLVYSERHAEDVDTEGEDHAYDAARYFLMSRPISMPVPQSRQAWHYDPLSTAKERKDGFLSL